jgi:hypothetical protein
MDNANGEIAMTYSTKAYAAKILSAAALLAMIAPANAAMRAHNAAHRAPVAPPPAFYATVDAQAPASQPDATLPHYRPEGPEVTPFP